MQILQKLLNLQKQQTFQRFTIRSKFIHFFLLKNLMNNQSEIIDLSNLANLQILQKVQSLLEESQFSKFTIILTRKQMQSDVRNSILSIPRKTKTRYSINTNSKPHDYNSRYSINKEEMNFQEEFNDNFHIGLSFYNRGLFQNSLEILLNEQVSIKQKLKADSVKDKQYQNVCFYIGNCYYRLKQFEKAIQYFTKKFEGEDLKQQGQKCNNLGSCYANLDQLRLSLNFYAEAYRIYQQFQEVDCSNLLNNIGMLYAQSQMYETAEKYFQQSIQERKLKSSDSCFQLYCTYQQLGNCQKHSKKYNEAISTFFQALKLSQKGIGDISQILGQLATIYQLSEKWNEALDCYEKLSVKSTRRGFLFEKAAQLHRNMGHLSDYDRFIKKAYEEYTIERNTRKLSELNPVVSRLTKK